jgi:hypothetical protein
MSRQHIYRCHILPIKRPSCSQTFDSSRMFTSHLQEASHCDRSFVETDEPIKGLEPLVQKLRSPKILADSPSEEHMWRVIYITLFPSDPKDDIPSPYHEKDQRTIYAISPYESTLSIPSAVPFIRTPDPAHFSNSLRGYLDTTTIQSSSIAPSLAAPTRPASIAGKYSQSSNNAEADGEAFRGDCPELSLPDQRTYQANGHTSIGSMAHYIGGDSLSAHQASQATQARQSVQSSTSSASSNRRKLKKKLRIKTVESQVLGFRAWQKPHRTDEHITAGVYRGFWIWLAHCLTFYIPIRTAKILLVGCHSNLTLLIHGAFILINTSRHDSI